ncbi:GntR family transcriptional regulator [Spirillospora albida]|uniref:GntR family transcriptional regulator n=1 Tax=Spirillospora albida TaxID=58123 RepID=UPI0004BF471E|nr:winged helix-turn-helix domain-containing protein [Spirillospora albida]
MIDLDGPTPIYLQIVAEVERRIAAGEYRPGRRIPSATALSEEFGVSRRTCVDALRVLRERGAVIGVPGRGTFVAEASERDE